MTTKNATPAMTKLSWEARSDLRFCAYNRKKHVAMCADGSSFLIRGAESSRAWEGYYISPEYPVAALGQFATLGEAKAAAAALLRA